MVRRVLFGVGILLVLPLVGIPCWIAMNRHDLPSVDDADLMFEDRVFDPEQGGHRWLRAAAEATRWPDTGDAYEHLYAILRRDIRDPVWVASRVAENREAFDLLERALAAPRLQFAPGFEPDLQWDLRDPIQTLVRLSAAQAPVLLREGDEDGAVDAALLGLRVGHAWSEAHGGNLIAMMYASAVQGISLQAVERLLSESSPSRPRAHRLAGRLESYRWTAEAWRRAWGAEYRSTEAVLREAESAYEEDPSLGYADAEGVLGWMLRQLPPGYLWQTSRTLQDFAGVYRELGARPARPCQEIYDLPEQTQADDEEEGPAPWRAYARLLRPNHDGRILFEISTPNFMSFDMKRCHLETRISLVQAMAALAVHRRDTGELPGRLEQLVPTYLESVPEDRFDGRPLRYSRADQVVYSIGDDFVDDGPPDAPSQANAKEPGISLPSSPSRPPRSPARSGR